MTFLRQCLLVGAILGAGAFLAAPATADWVPGDPYKMHFPQLPDEDGWDVNASGGLVVADDWTCTATGPVQDIHFWGSWMGGVTGTINSFTLSIHSNVPVGPGGYSIPGELLWERTITNFTPVPIDPEAMEGWYDPSMNPPTVLQNDHGNYFQYNVLLLPQDWFSQVQGTVYWLDISANVTGGVWGWKTADVSKYPSPNTGEHYLDDAVWAGGLVAPVWNELTDPITSFSLDMSFVITPEPSSIVLLVMAALGFGLFVWRRR